MSITATTTDAVNDQTQLPESGLSYSFAKKYGLLIADSSANPVEVICQNSVAYHALLEVRRFIGRAVSLTIVSDQEFADLLVRHYEASTTAATQMIEDFEGDLDLSHMAEEIQQTHDLLESEDDAPIIRLINALISEAVKAYASDIHIESFENSLNVRFRVDGVLRNVLAPNRVLAPLLVSRIKVMAKLDISEKRMPQDGRISLAVAGRPIDVRVSTLPARHGERVVLRLLDKQLGMLGLTNLGMSAADLQVVQQFITKPHGILLVTGPTGAGKTTTLYSILSAFDKSSQNILTVEDPVEYDLPGIGQTQVNSKIDMTFAKGLRAILRQDPDVVMVGEIRDLETAQIAVSASLTGHLVLSTLHTNNAIGAITRLIDMGVEPFLISSSLVGVIAQRLVRKLCPQCKQPVPRAQLQSQQFGIEITDEHKVFQPGACANCGDTGYKGRSGIYEVVVVDETLRQMIHEEQGELALEKYIRSKYKSIYQDGIRRVLAGQTTLSEVLRVSAGDSE